VGLREDKKERQRREILEAAVSHFRKRGYDRTRVRDVVESAAISEATFFNYFPTKDALLDELALVQVELLSETLRYQLQAENTAVPERIRETMRAVAAAIAQDRELQTVIYTRSSLFRSSGLLKERTFEMYGLLAALFEDGQDRGEIRGDLEPVQLAELLVASYQLTTTNWLIGWWGETGGLESRIMGAIEVFLDGCLPR
jgi:AcrR family transcriptional regulator